ncbi:phage-related tail fiber protein [Pseudomonas protegens]|uniref:phage tail protein n=1 Tax=Pseudomonas protegens TaxID=380021 RepID=UPI002894C3F7|nr:phage tail protein [Pseudomonas protegens]MDT3419626.1 phage-related tail fiber protein [Pseudomonas protegens]
MIDPNSQFFAILTAAGEAKQANADALGIPWKLTEMGVGDANGTDPIPDRAQTRLINERRRRPLNKLSVDPANPNIIVAEQIIPADEGGWWIREIGLYDADGALVAVANCAPSYKPLMSQGSGRTQVVRMNFIVSSAASVVLKIDPAVVLATRQYVDDSIADVVNRQDTKASVLVATTGPIQLAGTPTIDGVPVPLGSRVLVKDQAQAKDNGIYLTAEIWKRAADADTSAKVTPGLLVAVEQGAVSADTLWLLATDGPIVLGTTSLAFKSVTQSLAPINSPALTGIPTAPTAAQFDTSKALATTEFVQRAIGGFGRAFSYGSAGQVIQPSQVNAHINVFGACNSLTLPLLDSVPVGSVIGIGASSLSCSILRQGTDTIFLNSALAPASSITVNDGESVSLVSNGTQWIASGVAMLKHAASFAASLAPAGYQRLPGGLILQWGSAVSAGGATGNWNAVFYIAFPNACHSAAILGNGGSTVFSLVSKGTNGIKATAMLSTTGVPNADLGGFFIALGN